MLTADKHAESESIALNGSCLHLLSGRASFLAAAASSEAAARNEALQLRSSQRQRRSGSEE